MFLKVFGASNVFDQHGSVLQFKFLSTAGASITREHQSRLEKKPIMQQRSAAAKKECECETTAAENQ